MSLNYSLSASIVLYNEDVDTLTKTISSFLATSIKKKLFLLDNSPTDILKNVFKSEEIEYVFVGENIGFGSAHNLILDKINNQFDYHLVLNPDVEFDDKVILNLVKKLSDLNDVAMISPKVVYPNKEIQITCRKYPTVFDLINRRLNLSPNKNASKEYQDKDLNQSFYPEFIHGCFMLFKTSDFVKINGFDERYFLYMEDVDICKKIDQIGKRKLYDPKSTIFHQHRQGSSKKIKLLLYHISSAFKYFYKWGI